MKRLLRDFSIALVAAIIAIPVWTLIHGNDRSIESLASASWNLTKAAWSWEHGLGAILIMIGVPLAWGGGDFFLFLLKENAKKNRRLAESDGFWLEQSSDLGTDERYGYWRQERIHGRSTSEAPRGAIARSKR